MQKTSDQFIPLLTAHMVHICFTLHTCQVSSVWSKRDDIAFYSHTQASFNVGLGLNVGLWLKEKIKVKKKIK